MGVGYYFFLYLPKKRSKVIQEIKTMSQNSNVNLSDLNSNLWVGSNNWESYLDKCYSSSQINLFAKEIKKEIKQKATINQGKSIEELRKEAIANIENFAEKELRLAPSLEKDLKNFYKRIKQSSNNDISIIEQEAVDFIIQEKIKIQGLHWRREPRNWADRWLISNKQSFESSWQEMTRIMGEEPNHFSINAIYKIKFPPSLWNDLSEKQKQLAKSKGYGELTLRDQVQDYRFNALVDEWYDKVLLDPVRGEQDPNNPAELDNNALFYGAPRTGKSIKVEQLVYEADKYPLVVIQGSTLTPKSRDQKVNVDLLLKFIYTISTINNDLVDNFGYERAESGEPQYILFIDEGDQVCTTNLLPPKDASSQLTFLKECMGSDDKVEESKNLWIVATNHLNNVDIAVYQSGRLSNALSFSWTLGTFMYYAEEAGITSKFPDHWINTKDLNSEDIKQVNRFNKILFDKYFLGKVKNREIDIDKSFWNKFISNEENKETLEEIKEEEKDKDDKVIIDEKTGKPKQIIKQKGIQLGEFFEFFWQKFDNKEIEEFDGKFTKPKKLNMEEAIMEASNHISNTLDVRLKELEKASSEILKEMKLNNDSFNTNFIKAKEEISHMLSEIGSKINS